MADEMRAIKHKGGFTITSNDGEPEYQCLGTCKKIWWKAEIEERFKPPAAASCPNCGGKIGKVPS